VKMATAQEVDGCVGETWKCILWGYNHRTNTVQLAFRVEGKNAQGEPRAWSHHVGLSPETRREMGLAGASMDETIEAAAARWVMPQVQP
jgi:hypothetical protein